MSKLNLIFKTKIKIKEPSGLCLGFEPDTLFTVSDKTGKISEISTKGDLIKEYNLKNNDPEGVCTDTHNKHIYVVEERGERIVQLDKNAEKINEFKLPKLRKDKNSGLEGITYNMNTQTFYILNEKSPGLLLYWHPAKGITERYELTFAKDYSGIAYDLTHNTLWILSDDSELIAQCDLKGKLIQKFEIPIRKAEGICISNDGTTLYCVSDAENKLYGFSLEQG